MKSGVIRSLGGSTPSWAHRFLTSSQGSRATISGGPQERKRRSHLSLTVRGDHSLPVPRRQQIGIVAVPVPRFRRPICQRPNLIFVVTNREKKGPTRISRYVLVANDHYWTISATMISMSRTVGNRATVSGRLQYCCRQAPAVTSHSRPLRGRQNGHHPGNQSQLPEIAPVMPLSPIWLRWV